MKTLILFDLDGTLTNPFEGITRSVQYALRYFGIEEPDRQKLAPFIGPPLVDSFMNFYGFSEQQAKQAVEKYRERYRDIGIYENELYEGIDEMLRELEGAGCILAVASSKPEVFVNRVLEHFSIRQYFTVVVGSELSGIRGTKEEVVEDVFRRLSSRPEDYGTAVMVGDREYDVQGARQCRMTAVGVRYGFAFPDELERAGADHVVDTVEDLRKLLMRIRKSDIISR